MIEFLQLIQVHRVLRQLHKFFYANYSDALHAFVLLLLWRARENRLLRLIGHVLERRHLLRFELLQDVQRRFCFTACLPLISCIFFSAVFSVYDEDMQSINGMQILAHVVFKSSDKFILN